MKFVLLLIVFITCVYIGFEIKKYFEDRVKLSDAILSFCEYAKKQIDFYNTPKDQIIDQYNSGILKKVLSGESDKLLSVNENNKVQEFLSSIGKYDAQNELNNIEFYKLYFQSLKEKCTQDLQKKGGLSLKLSILIGILLCILLF